MTKRIIKLLLLLALAVGLYFVTAKADNGEMKQPKQIAQPSTTEMLAITDICEVATGFNSGTVNLRTCAGTSCEVIRVLTEGERLTILTMGDWKQVTTADGVTGYIKSNYCKGK